MGTAIVLFPGNKGIWGYSQAICNSSNEKSNSSGESLWPPNIQDAQGIKKSLPRQSRYRTSSGDSSCQSFALFGTVKPLQASGLVGVIRGSTRACTSNTFSWLVQSDRLFHNRQVPSTHCSEVPTGSQPSRAFLCSIRSLYPQVCTFGRGEFEEEFASSATRKQPVGTSLLL